MPDLSFAVEGAEPVSFAAAPLLALKLRVSHSGPDAIKSIALRCQIQIEATRRRYEAKDHELLLELFGEPERWSQTLKSMLWTFTNATVPPFEGDTLVDLPVPCTYDFNVAAAKYFHALQDGEVPLTLMFSGSVFYETSDGALQVTQIPWEKEATYRLPVRVWKEMMEQYYPNTAFLSLRRDIFDRLYRYKMQHSLPTWEQAVEQLLETERIREMTGLNPATETMLERARQVANAVLYEGYILYPYRPSATKNRQRWTFGGVYPEAYSAAQGGTDASSTQTECLLRGDGATLLDVRLRFLHLCARQVAGRSDGATAEAGVPAGFRAVDSLRANGRRYSTWQEAVEREVEATGLALDELAANACRIEIRVPADRGTELIYDLAGETGGQGGVAGLILRRQKAIAGQVEFSAEEARPGLYRLRVRVVNTTPMPDARSSTRDEALLLALVSTHLILHVRGGELLSMIDPPVECRDLAVTCHNIGTYPVLVGEAGGHDLMLSSPIILYDYPQIAPESAGDLFDGTEIDEILSLRIMTMTDEEKEEARAADPRACELLDRTDALPAEELMRLHGALRSVRPELGDGEGR